MRKTISILILVLLSTTGFSQSNGTNLNCAELPQKKIPLSAVNDFSDIIKVETETALEEKLTNYWNTTTIALVVVTVNSLDGNDVGEYAIGLYNCWGVGDKTNRGVLMLVAPNERKVFICTGQGIEFILTDGMCKRVIEESIIPSFKAGDYPLGILNGVDHLIKILGTMSWEDRMAAIEERAQIKKKEAQEIRENFDSALMLFGIFIVIAVVLLFLINLFQKLKRRRSNKKTIKQLDLEIDKAYKMIDALRENCKEQAPKWAQKEMEDHLNLSMINITNARSLVSESRKKVGKIFGEDQGSILSELQQAGFILVKAFSNFEKVDTKLRAKVKKFSAEVKDVWNNALTVSSECYNTVNSYIGKGYEFDPELVKIEKILKRLDSIQADISDRENHKDVCETSAELKAKALEIETRLSEMVKSKKKVDKDLPEITLKLNESKEKLYAYSEKVRSLRKKYDRSAWGKLEESLLHYSRKMNGELEARVNSMKNTEKFSITSIDLLNQNFRSLTSMATGVLSVFSAIDDLPVDQEKARTNFLKKIPKAEEAIEEALKEIKDSDVGEGAKKEAKKAVQELKAIKLEAEDGIADWVSLFALLVACITTAEIALETAKSDIAAASRRRSNAVAAAAAAKKRKEDNDSVSFSTYSSGGFSSGGGGGFGGFGGGFSGGGGAGGSW